MKNLKSNKLLRSYSLSRTHLFGLAAVFIAVGVFILIHVFAASVNTTQLDNGTCKQNLQQANPTYSGVNVPSFLLTGDGAQSSYSVAIDGSSIGTFNANSIGNVCIYDTAALSEGSHTLTAQEVAPHPSNTVPAFSFVVDTTPLAAPANLSLSVKSDTGIQGDNNTTYANPNISGTSVPSVPIRVYNSTGSIVGGTLALADGTWTAALSSNLPVGVNTLTAVTVNPAGVESAHSTPYTFTIDSIVPPTVSITSPLNNATINSGSTVNLAVNASDTAYPIWEVEYMLDGKLLQTTTASPFSFAWDDSGSNGNHTLTAIAIDTMGDQTTSTPISFTVGQAGSNPPTVPGTPITTSPTGNKSPTFTWTPSSDTGGPGLANAPYTIQLSTDSTFSSNTSTSISPTNSYTLPPSSGTTWYIRVSATDTNDQTSAWSPTGSVLIEPTPLTVIINTPTSGQTVSGVIPVTGTVVDSNPLSTIELFVDGGLVASSTSSPFNFSWDTTKATNGSYRFEVYSADTAGNSNNTQFYVTVANGDTTPPTIAITSPTAGATVSGVVPVNVTASDNVGVTKVQFYVDGTLTSTDTSAPYNFSWNSNGLQNGRHILSAEAYDANGNTATTQVAVTLSAGDTTPPSTPTGVNGTSSSTSQIALSWGASTDNVGVAGYYITRSLSNVSGSGTTIAKTTGTGTTYSDTGLTAGTTYYYQVMAYDAAGNTSGLSTVSPGITTLPAVAPPPPTEPGGLQATQAGSTQINLSWTPSTSSAGIAGYNVYRVIGTGTPSTTGTPINGGTLVPNSSSGPVTYGDSGLSPSTTYTYVVVAYDTSSPVQTSPTSTPASATTAPPVVTTGSLGGAITYHKGKKVKALAGVTVSLNLGGDTDSVTATKKGIYYLPNLPVGSSLVSYTHKKYKTQTQTVGITAGTETIEDITMTKGK